MFGIADHDSRPCSRNTLATQAQPVERIASSNRHSMNASSIRLDDNLRGKCDHRINAAMVPAAVAPGVLDSLRIQCVLEGMVACMTCWPIDHLC